MSRDVVVRRRYYDTDLPRSEEVLVYGDALHGAIDNAVLLQAPRTIAEHQWVEEELSVRIAPGGSITIAGEER